MANPLFKKNEVRESVISPIDTPWKILVVDDEEDVLVVTKLALRDMEINGNPVELLYATSAREAKEQFEKNSDIALILLDVVMESDDAGLQFVRYVRNELKNPYVRIILRTGQPGQAPEKEVIDTYDINDYKEKTELNRSRLYTVVRTSILTYKNLMTLKQNRDGLELIINSSPAFLRISSFETFFKGILLSISGLFGGIHAGAFSTPDSIAYMRDQKEEAHQFCFGVGKYSDITYNSQAAALIIEEVEETYRDKPPKKNGIEIDITHLGNIVVPIYFNERIFAFVYIKGPLVMNGHETSLLKILSSQVSIAFENMLLYQRMIKQNSDTMMMLATASEYKDVWTGEHVLRIKELSTKVALKIGLSQKEANEIGESSVLHDIGKIAIDENILKKEGKLSDEEFKMVKEHPEKGKALLEKCESLATAATIAGTHHEKWDGSGYPNGLKGEEIPLSGRIIAIIDVYDALIHKRPYKEAWEKADAIEYIKNNSGTHFDPKAVVAFLEVIKEEE